MGLLARLLLWVLMRRPRKSITPMDYTQVPDFIDNDDDDYYFRLVSDIELLERAWAITEILESNGASPEDR